MTLSDEVAYSEKLKRRRTSLFSEDIIPSEEERIMQENNQFEFT